MTLLAAVVVAEGVRVAVQVMPPSELDRFERAALGAVRSAVVKPVTASEKVKVMVAVSPLFNVEALLVMARVGAWVSKVRDGVVPAPPLLPAASL